ncbi:hypothetical protein ABZV60_32900 [Streptomyces sp. NPDC004787]|uniref:hypothetical protein n=1 Tax=Streptomyces sp. NPDC004787 TaxID=3154291 RepID=UPI0033B368E6
MSIRVSTARQPYADAIIWGGMTTANRSLHPSPMHLGSTILIHAAKAPQAPQVTTGDLGLAHHAPDTRGAVIGSAVSTAATRPPAAAAPPGA